MKKVLIFILMIVLLMLPVTVAQASAITILIDGRQIPAKAEDVSYYELGKYYLDVFPELISGNVFIPLRVISDYLGADISWQAEDNSVILKYGENTVTLNPGGKSILKNGDTLTIEHVPYIKNGRTMVYSSLIENIFDCEISFSGGSVEISIRPLYIDKIEVTSVQRMSTMVVDRTIDESDNRLVINRLYQLIQNNCGAEIPAPDYYGRLNNSDIHTYYARAYTLSFMETTGVDGITVRQYDVYRRMNDDPSMSGIMEKEGTDYGELIINELTSDIWCKLLRTDFDSRYYEICNGLGEWETIYTTN